MRQIVGGHADQVDAVGVHLDPLLGGLSMAPLEVFVDSGQLPLANNSS
jgi:hypothetical protein